MLTDPSPRKPSRPVATMTQLRTWLNLLIVAVLFAISPTSMAGDPCASTGSQPVVADLDTVVKSKPTPREDLSAMEDLAKTPRVADAPATVTLPKVFNDGSQGAWDDSLPGGESKEQGGILVKDAKGNYVWKRGSAGKSASWQPNYGDVKSGETIVAVLHTHPYGKSEGNLTDVGFSGGDLSAMVYAPEPLDMVQSGTGMHMIAKSQEFVDKVNKMTDDEKYKYYQQIDADFEAALNANFAAGQDFKTAVNNAAVSTSKKHGLIYYKGTAGGALSLVK